MEHDSLNNAMAAMEQRRQQEVKESRKDDYFVQQYKARLRQPATKPLTGKEL